LLRIRNNKRRGTTRKHRARQKEEDGISTEVWLQEALFIPDLKAKPPAIQAHADSEESLGRKRPFSS
jgi:hypothetical protein